MYTSSVGITPQTTFYKNNKKIAFGDTGNIARKVFFSSSVTELLPPLTPEDKAILERIYSLPWAEMQQELKKLREAILPQLHLPQQEEARSMGFKNIKTLTELQDAIQTLKEELPLPILPPEDKRYLGRLKAINYIG